MKKRKKKKTEFLERVISWRGKKKKVFNRNLENKCIINIRLDQSLSIIHYYLKIFEYHKIISYNALLSEEKR